MKTLVIMDQYGFSINIFNLQSIYFGNSKIDSNQCTNYKQDFYRFVDGVPDLTQPYLYGKAMQSQEFKDNTTRHDAPMMSITLYENRGTFIDIQYSNVP